MEHLFVKQEFSMRRRHLVLIAELRQEHETGRMSNERHAIMPRTERIADTIFTAAKTVDSLARRVNLLGKGSVMDCDTTKPDAVARRSLLLQHHLISITEAITRTRQEIAALRQEQETGRPRDELHAVVQGTEQATDSILTAAENVQTLARGIATRAQDAATRTDAEVILAEMQTIFEACNFQDLTGQRIAKVVRTIVQVEERIGEMLRLWSGPADAVATARPPLAERSAEAALLNGPVLPGDASVSQDAVDALFA